MTPESDSPSPAPATAPAAARTRPSVAWTRRVPTGIAGVLMTIAIVFYGNGLVTALGVAVFAIMGANEFYTGVKRQGAEPNEFLGYVACIVCQLGAYAGRGAARVDFLPVSLTLLLLTTMLLELGKRRQKPILNIGATILGAIYVGWLFSFITLLRGWHFGLIKPPISHTDSGSWLVIFVIVVTWAGDTGGLLVGYLLGRNKLAPQISPGKTWEGATGGTILGLILAVALGGWIGLPLVHGIVLGVLLPVVGLIGDLCESALKRELHLKDFGTFFPGHGGVLDRADSLLFSAPVAYYYMTLLAPR